MNKFLFKVFVTMAFVITCAGYSKAQNLNLIPYPSQVEVLKGNCVLNNSPLFINNKELFGLPQFFNEENRTANKKQPDPKADH